MTTSVPPVVPKSIPRGAAADPETPGRTRQPLPVPASDAQFARATDTVYALSAVDKRGRIGDRSIVQVLGWAPGTRLDIRERAGIIMVRAALDGVHRIDSRGYLVLPLAVRRWCRLAAGDRVLLAADPINGVLAAHPLATLDRLLAGAHEVVAGGEVA
ncbi:hypothetical protein [Plantactinospora sp. KLBMP9567]|uniref:hypothetical protein n=1 Tax=Plantactinospora sp. KLBMP9567 TaxID=3085900 RepID=UPI002980D60E|nr:hypothetical protein [Plantactinospora sp. KLBMP9567]MDW5325330.1 hypothetical protein [Plantactinospora sp. KLBMP9567]